MDVSALLSLSAGREVAQLTIVDEVLRIDVVATAEGRACPLCAEVATHVRSYYTRAVADLPCAGHRVQLMLQVRKFRCDTASCPRKVFAERLGPFIEAWAHKTARLRKAIESIGLATCREGGARLASPSVWECPRRQPPCFVLSWPCRSLPSNLFLTLERFRPALWANVWHCPGGLNTP